MTLLGINSVYHETAAAITVDGKIMAAAEEERFNRRKHGKAARVDNPQELPAQAIRYCLRAAGVSARELDAVSYSFNPSLRKQRFVFDGLSNKGDWGDAEGETVFRNCLDRVPDALSDLLQEDIGARFHWVPHHLAHAASAYYPSGFDDAAILVVDGIGESSANYLASGEGDRISPLEEIPYPHSLGFLWEKICRFLGFSEYDACKVMGLAAYGDASVPNAFEPFLTLEEECFSIDPEVLEFRRDSYGKLERYLGPRRLRGQPLTQHHANIAAALQSYNDAAVLALARRLFRRRPSPRLCFAGGVALNCSSNYRLKEMGPFEEVFIPPAPHDAGTAIGAALAVEHCHGRRGSRTACLSPYFGPEFDTSQCKNALHSHGLDPSGLNELAREAARLLAAGKIVGWFQGRMEFGPRALGNRSLLADPRSPESRQRMNELVKRRDGFRPFAPSVLEERSAEWFDLGKPSPSYGFMLFACPVRPDKLDRIPAVVHTDGTSRVQLVNRQTNPRYHELISCFEELTGVPMLLNTSFNDTEPIVCSPEDAVRTFLNTGIDALVLGDQLVGAPGRVAAAR
jgi:carbamoyltransferase